MTLETNALVDLQLDRAMDPVAEASPIHHIHMAPETSAEVGDQPTHATSHEEPRAGFVRSSVELLSVGHEPKNKNDSRFALRGRGGAPDLQLY